MNIDYDRYQHFFEHLLNFNQTWTSYSEYLYNQLKYYNELRNEAYSSVEAEFYSYLQDPSVTALWQDYDNITHHRFFHDYVMELCGRYTKIFEAGIMLLDTYENHSLYFMCSYYINNPPFLETPRVLNQEKNIYPLSYQFNRKSCNHIMVSIYEFIEGVSVEQQQGLYYQITNDFMDLFDKIQEDCDSMLQLGINNLLTNGCLTPHPECKRESLFFSPGIPMEYIKYLMVQKLNDGDDINGYSWLKKRIDEAPLINKNSMHLADRIIPFDEEYNDILKRYQSGLNTMERTISSLLNFKLQVISGDNSLKIPENISSEEFITERNVMIMNYQIIEDAHSDGAFRYLESRATSSVKISGEDGAFGTPPPRAQSQTPSPKKQTTPTTALRKAGKAEKVKTEVLFDDVNKKVTFGAEERVTEGRGETRLTKEALEKLTQKPPSTVDDDAMSMSAYSGISEDDGDGYGDIPYVISGRELDPIKRQDSMRSFSTVQRTVSDDSGGQGEESQRFFGSQGSSQGGMRKINKRKKKTRKRVYFKDLLDAPKKGGKRKKKTRKRIYFKDLLGGHVQSGGLIPRRIYFNDLL